MMYFDVMCFHVYKSFLFYFSFSPLTLLAIKNEAFQVWEDLNLGVSDRYVSWWQVTQSHPLKNGMEGNQQWV